MLFRSIAKIITSLIDLVSYIDNGTKKFNYMGLVVAGLVASFSPFLSIVVALGTALNDIQNWKAGGKAMFGDLYTTISGIADKLKYLKNAITGAFDFDESTQKNIDKFTGAMSNLKGSLQLGLLGALIGGKIGGVQGAVVGGGVGLGAGLLNWLIEANKSEFMSLYRKSNDETQKKRELIKQQDSNKTQQNNITLNTTINTDSNLVPEVFNRSVKNGLENLQLNNHGF